MRRPWKVFVYEIGPTFSFASEKRARDRARSLVERDYARVHVWQALEFPLRRWVYLYGTDEVVEQTFEQGNGWTPVARV